MKDSQKRQKYLKINLFLEKKNEKKKFAQNFETCFLFISRIFKYEDFFLHAITYSPILIIQEIFFVLGMKLNFGIRFYQEQRTSLKPMLLICLWRDQIFSLKVEKK